MHDRAKFCFSATTPPGVAADPKIALARIAVMASIASTPGMGRDPAEATEDRRTGVPELHGRGGVARSPLNSSGCDDARVVPSARRSNRASETGVSFIDESSVNFMIGQRRRVPGGHESKPGTPPGTAGFQSNS